MQKDDALHPQGLYNPLFRFAFTNVTKEPFTSYWNSKPITVPAGATVKLNHHMAVKLTKELVDKLMMGEAKMDEEAYYQKNPNTMPTLYRSPKGMSLGVPAARKVWEDAICKQLETETDGIQLEVIRAEMIESLSADLNQKPSSEPVAVPVATLSGSENPTKLPEVFAELKN